MPSQTPSSQILTLRGSVNQIDTQGHSHPLSAGSSLHPGDHLVLQSGAEVTLGQNAGAHTTLAGPLDLILTPDVLTGAPLANTPPSPQAIPDIQQVLTALAQGQDPFGNLPPAAAGETGGDVTGNSGHSFVRLARIDEALTTNVNIATTAPGTDTPLPVTTANAVVPDDTGFAPLVTPTITISSDGSVSGVYNKADSGAVIVSGTSTSVETGQPVTVTFSDGNGHSVTVSTTVQAGGGWTAPAANLAGLTDGPLTVTATTHNLAGTPASFSDSDILHAHAALTINNDGSVGGVYNKADSGAVIVSGAVAGVEAGQTVTVTFTDSHGNTVTATTTVQGNGSWAISPVSLAPLADGSLTLSATATDKEGNVANATHNDTLDTFAAIAISSDGSVAGMYNLADSRAVTVSGTVTGVETGQPVTVVFTDALSHTVTANTTVQAGGVWSITPASLASLSDGPITVSAATQDRAGNPAQISDNDMLDTHASISIGSDGSIGGVYNKADSGAVIVSGTVSGVETGESVMVIFTDAHGNTVSATSTVLANGTWTLPPASLAGLVDGPVTVSATTQDHAGNIATASNNDTLDTFASLAISSDGSVAGVYNLADSRSVIVSGTVAGVETGQPVTVTFIDANGHSVSANTNVQIGGTWSISPVSLAHLTDGAITVTASAADRAGNPASSSNNDTLDTFASLAISNDGSVDGIYNQADSHAVVVSGTVVGVETGQPVTVTFADAHGHTVSASATVQAGGTWAIAPANLAPLSDGPVTVSAATADKAGNPASGSNSDVLDTHDSITIGNDGSVAGVYNRADSGAVIVTGTVVGVEAGQTVTVTFTDTNSNTLSTTAVVQGSGAWTTNPINIGSLTNGSITVSATATDLAGNVATTTHSDTLDTVANIAISSDGSAGGFYNLADSRSVNVNGTVTGVETGQAVTVTFSDTRGHTVIANTTVQAGGAWSITPANLSSLVDGQVTVTASTHDQAGNPATTSRSDTLDTHASLSISSDGSVGGVYNLADSRSVIVSGTVSGVEAGQPVTVVFRDSQGNTVTENTTVQAGGNWSSPAASLASLTDGPVTVTASTSDRAGNPASASDSDTLDTFAAIAITSDGSVSGVYNLADSGAVTVSGTVLGVEAGQTVTVTFSDAASDTITAHATVRGDGTWSITPISMATLVDGPVTVTASTQDRAGNTAMVSDNDTLDTFASIAINSDGSISNVYNKADSGNVTVTGTATGVESGQPVAVSITDSASHTVMANTTVQADGSWVVSSINLAPLTDGPVTVTATTHDKAGNPASTSDSDTLDTTASIAISSDGSVGGVYNNTDSGAVVVSGTVAGVEVGQGVSVTFTDGSNHSVTATTTVSNGGTWTTPPANLGSLLNGPLTVTAATMDKAGNPASATNTDSLTGNPLLASTDSSVDSVQHPADHNPGHTQEQGAASIRLAGVETIHLEVTIPVAQGAPKPLNPAPALELHDLITGKGEISLPAAITPSADLHALSGNMGSATAASDMSMSSQRALEAVHNLTAALTSHQAVLQSLTGEPLRVEHG